MRAASPLLATPIIEIATLITAPIDLCFDLARDIDLHIKSTEGPMKWQWAAEVKLLGTEITVAHLELLRGYLDLAKQALGGEPPKKA